MADRDERKPYAEEPTLLSLQDCVSEWHGGDLRATITVRLANTPPNDSLESDTTVQTWNDGVHLQEPLETKPQKTSLVVGEHIGSGGLAVVDAAIQNSLLREVAIKRLREDKNTPSNRENLIREAHLLARLNHPHIAPVYELAYDQQDMPILIMKRIEGDSWTQRLSLVNPFAEPQDRYRFHIGTLLKVCHAVEYAHSRGILHLDLKTDNVMIGSFGEVYLLDWGIAVEMDENMEFRMNTFAGTPCFAAPEMFDPREPRTPQTDVYLLGAVLHEILTLAPLHNGQTLEDTIEQARLSEPYPYDDNIPPVLAAIAHKATERDPGDRHASVQQLRQALQVWIDQPHIAQLLRAATTKLKELESKISMGPKNPFPLYQLAFETRFAFLQVVEASPESKEAQEGLLQTLKLLFLFVIGRGQLDEGRVLLGEIERQEKDVEVTQSLRELLEHANLKAMRTSELTTQIQYKLLEQLQKGRQRK